jgi:uncharacterized protein YrrD
MSMIVKSPRRIRNIIKMSNNMKNSKSLLSASSVTGNKIKNTSDDTLGTVDEIMLDCSTGKIAYVVMSAGGFLGIGEKLFALPMSALTIDLDNKCFRTGLSKEIFEKADGFDKDQWPDMANPSWKEKNHSSFGAHPYLPESACC